MRHNLERVRELVPGSKVWSVVKANAYGHGLIPALEGLKTTDGFALLDLAEAKLLREMGWQGPILLLEGLFCQEDIFLLSDLHCDCVVHHIDQVDWLEALSEAKQGSGSHLPKVYLKMNTGMNRLGFRPNQ